MRGGECTTSDAKLPAPPAARHCSCPALAPAALVPERAAAYLLYGSVDCIIVAMLCDCVQQMHEKLQQMLWGKALWGRACSGQANKTTRSHTYEQIQTIVFQGLGGHLSVEYFCQQLQLWPVFPRTCG